MRTEKASPKFEHVALILETQEEVDGIYALLRSQSVCDAVGFGHIDPSELFPERLGKTDKLYDSLNKILK